MRQHTDPDGSVVTELETDAEVTARDRHDELLGQGVSTLAAAERVEREFRGQGLSEEFHTWLRDGLSREEAFLLMRGAHEAVVTPSGSGFLVECPRGCNLGESRHAGDEKAAEQRVALHRLSTALLAPQR